MLYSTHVVLRPPVNDCVNDCGINIVGIYSCQVHEHIWRVP